MVWKSGKSGIRNGRTVRSRFAHKTRSRREGLLIHSSSDENQEKSELVTYSLGKQNRWLLPEVIKTNSVEIENEVVLVERFSSEGTQNNRRADCFSVYSPESSTTHRPRRRFSHAKNLLIQGEHVKSRYEVAYPYPAGLWPAGRELGRQRVGTHLRHRKKNASACFMLEEECDDNTEEMEDMISDNEHDSQDQWGFYKPSGRSSTFDLMDWMTAPVTRKLPESRNINTPTDSRKRVENCKEKGPEKGKCIYMGIDNEMYDVHLELLAQIKETSSALVATEEDNVDSHTVSNKVRRRARRWRWRRKRWNRRFQNRNSADDYGEPSSLQVGVFEPVVGDTKRFTIALRHQDVTPEALKQRWGKFYKEGSCLPRTFALDITPLISDHVNVTEEALIVLFQLVENQPGFASNKVKAFVSIVTCHDKTISETMWPKLVSQMKANKVGEEMWSLEDLVDIMLACFCSEIAGLKSGKADYSEPRKPKQSLCILNDLLGWNTKTFSAKGARKEVKKLLVKGTSNQVDHASCSSVDMEFKQYMDCGICFEELHVLDVDGLPNYTALMDCGHMFCNNCWKAHLETQIHSGQVVLRCPGHKCRTLIDDVTLLFLVPSWYSRHIDRKLDSFMETSPDWRWCPADRCKLVAKTTALQSTNVQEEPGTMIQPVPVICSCGNMWCFKCQEDAHWPATCNEAHVFRQKNEGYANMLRTDKARLITSVDVKNCPFCHYPIEKNQGCDHMVCSMCYKEFCWLCLQEWGYPHFCKKTSPLIKQRHVELPIYTKHFRTYEHVAATSRISRSSSVILNIHRRLDKLALGVKNFELFSSLKKDCNDNGCVPRLLNSISKTNAVQHLREVFNFKFQALLALEGAAITLSFSKETGNKFALEFDRLLFIVERLDEILQNLSESCQTRSLEKLAHFVTCGKKCILALGRSREICN